MLKIHNAFVGGNIRVKEICGDTVFLENELRDTEGDWFYWAFCVEGAQGRELTFSFQPTRLGYWGPAVSHDLKTWHWLGQVDENCFTYRFGEDETIVYFAHHMLYHPDRFSAFAQATGLPVATLCQSRKGREVPCVCVGEGSRSMILTARHHACESTGNYVLEGVLESLAAKPLADTRVLCVPFVDYDGVVDGDQGKARRPHDHNRDYTSDTASIYPEVAAIRAHADAYGCHLGFDFHSPWHRGGGNDTIFIVQNSVEKLDRFERFADCLTEAITPDSMQYEKSNDYPPMTGWNQPCPSFSHTMDLREECDIALTLENAYFGTPENVITAERLKELGRCFAEAIRRYVGQ